MLVTSNVNGNTIFLPAAGYWNDDILYNADSYGYYWSSSLDESFSDSARYMFFNSDGSYGYNNDRYFGQSVRPVTE